MSLPFSTFKYMHEEIREEMIRKFTDMYDYGWFIDGKECESFEKEFAEYCSTNYCVGISNGLDAIVLSLRALGIKEGDEVIVPSNTFIATAFAISSVGAKPILVDPDPITYNMSLKGLREALSSKTKAIIPVHLYGQAADLDEIISFAKEHKLFVIEDCAQAHRAHYKGKKVGGFGDVGCYSFYPGKNLGALGDGGAVVTNNKALAECIRSLSNYGSSQKYNHIYKGYNCRLDELQAGFLRIKLKKLDEYTKFRQKVAAKYQNEITNPRIVLPQIGKNRDHVWHIYAILCETRDDLKEYLGNKGIDTISHYPIAIADQKAYEEDNLAKLPIAAYIARNQLSLPLYIGMKNEEIDYVIQSINAYRV